MELGNQIKAHRAVLSLSQEELAEKVYVTRQTVSNWETGVSHSYRYHTKYDEPTLIHYQL